MSDEQQEPKKARPVQIASGNDLPEVIPDEPTLNTTPASPFPWVKKKPPTPLKPIKGARRRKIFQAMSEGNTSKGAITRSVREQEKPSLKPTERRVPRTNTAPINASFSMYDLMDRGLVERKRDVNPETKREGYQYTLTPKGVIVYNYETFGNIPSETGKLLFQNIVNGDDDSIPVFTDWLEENGYQKEAESIRNAIHKPVREDIRTLRREIHNKKETKARKIIEKDYPAMKDLLPRMKIPLLLQPPPKDMPNEFPYRVDYSSLERQIGHNNAYVITKIVQNALMSYNDTKDDEKLRQSIQEVESKYQRLLKTV
jgi:hypothetical protein